MHQKSCNVTLQLCSGQCEIIFIRAPPPTVEIPQLELQKWRVFSRSQARPIADENGRQYKPIGQSLPKLTGTSPVNSLLQVGQN
jgi:hypothetical protein